MSKIHELFSDPSKWTQGALARDATGKQLYPGTNPHAVCFCLMGALQHCYVGSWNELDSPLYLAGKKLVDEVIAVVHMPLYRFNDAKETTFEMVKALVIKLDV